MRYEIYQIKDMANTDYAFMRFDKEKFTLDDYEKVYAGELEQKDLEVCEQVLFDTPVLNENALLEGIYTKFNAYRPEGFEGHSLSVSDVIKLDDSLYYVEPIGFKKIR